MIRNTWQVSRCTTSYALIHSVGISLQLASWRRGHGGRRSVAGASSSSSMETYQRASLWRHLLIGAHTWSQIQTSIVDGSRMSALWQWVRGSKQSAISATSISDLARSEQAVWFRCSRFLKSLLSFVGTGFCWNDRSKQSFTRPTRGCGSRVLWAATPQGAFFCLFSTPRRRPALIFLRAMGGFFPSKRCNKFLTEKCSEIKK